MSSSISERFGSVDYHGLRPYVVAALLVTSLAVISLAGLYLSLVPNTLKDARRKHLPPGPKGLPLVGNMFDLADSELVRHHAQRWYKEFGPVFYTKIGATDYVWLSSPKAVKDLLDKKSSIYSSRAPAPYAQDVASGGKRQLFMEYGKDWRSLRKASHSLLNSTAAVKYQPIQDLESKQLLTELLDTPKDFYEHNRRYSSSVIMYVTYGYRLPSWQHPLVARIYAVLDNLTEMTAPGAHAVDSFPSLARLPEWMMGNWKTQARKYFEHDSAAYLSLWRELKRSVDDGTANECFCKDFYQNDPEKHGIDELLAAYTCGGLVEAGSETTSTTLNNFILAMLLFPQAMKRAQDELDRVVGSDRMPNWEDEKDLPYVRALVKEVLRWRPVNKFGMPHCTSEDDWYEGMFIPKGSVIMLNWWAIQYDETLYKMPNEFEPARFLDKPLSAADYINVNDPRERDHFTYGAGRRVCPGVHVAERSLYINIARTLWGFNISKAKDQAGAVIEPDTAMVRGFLSVPNKFDAEFNVRSKEHEKTIRKEFAAVSKA